MLLREVIDIADNNAKTLAAVSTLLSDRADDETAQKQISQNAFIKLAQDLGINVTKENLGDMITKEPLKNILEPLDPNSGVVKFKGNTEATTGMSVDMAQQVVDANAKAAMKRGMKNS